MACSSVFLSSVGLVPAARTGGFTSSSTKWVQPVSWNSGRGRIGVSLSCWRRRASRLSRSSTDAFITLLLITVPASTPADRPQAGGRVRPRGAGLRLRRSRPLPEVAYASHMSFVLGLVIVRIGVVEELCVDDPVCRCRCFGREGLRPAAVAVVGEERCERMRSPLSKSAPSSLPTGSDDVAVQRGAMGEMGSAG